jgi:DNA polymerase
MDSTGDDELEGEVLALTRQLRGQLVRHASLGAWAAPGGDTAAPPPGAFAPPIADVDQATAARLHALGRRTLTELRADLGECTRCPLHAKRRSIVFGVGAIDAPLMFVGEGPGEQEDKRGEPFVGPAGELLDKMIEAMGWTRDSVYIANIVMCRPPGNRNPAPAEIAACLPFLEDKIRTVAPRIIVALGRPAANTLLANDAPISALRGTFHDRQDVRVMPTFHPAYLLREPDKKRDTWADLKLVMAELARLGIDPPARG